jgi:hypothetical protein
VSEAPGHYTSPDEDSGRWIGFPFREGDIVIGSRSKTGTTWVQMICVLLVFQTPKLPDSLSNLSPWLDWLVTPRADVYAQLAAQGHRRFIKSHTPLDGLPADSRVTYIVTGRHPLDMAVSLYHVGADPGTGTPEAPTPLLLPAAAALPIAAWLAVTRRRRRVSG